MKNTRVSQWARSMAQLMSQKVVTEDDIKMVLEAHGIDSKEEIEPYNNYMNI